MRKFFIKHKIINQTVINGLVLLFLTLFLEVNPAEFSVPAQWVLGTPIWWALAISSLPAWILGVMLSGSTIYLYPIMFLIQFVLYWVLGRFIVSFKYSQ